MCSPFPSFFFLSLSTTFSLLFQPYLSPRSRYLLFNHLRICWTCLGHCCHSAQPIIHVTNSMALFGGTKWHSYATCWHSSPPALSSTTQELVVASCHRHRVRFPAGWICFLAKFSKSSVTFLFSLFLSHSSGKQTGTRTRIGGT